MKIIDAHHHFWDPAQNPHPWLTDEPMIPFRYGDYSPIRRRFMPEDYDAAAAGWEITASVTMEGEWDPSDPTGEAVWMAALAAETGRPAAHSAQAWLDRADLDAVLERYVDVPLVRSVRHKPRANPKPGGPEGGMADAAFRRGFAKLSTAGLMFELQTPWWHLDEAVAMAAASPETPIILNHAGLPSDRAAEAITGWRAALSRFAALPQAVVKISGLGLKGQPWRLEDNRDVIRMAIDAFGPSRAMVASNFPVDGLCGSFDTLLNGYLAATADYTEAERHDLFFGAAARVYDLRIDPNAADGAAVANNGQA